MATQTKDRRKTTQRRADGDAKEKSMPNYLKPTMSSCGSSHPCQYPTSKQSASVRKSAVIIAKTTLPSPSPQPQAKKKETRSRDHKVSSLLPKPSKPAAVSAKATNQPPLRKKNRSLFTVDTSKSIHPHPPGSAPEGKQKDKSPPKTKVDDEEKHEDKIQYEEGDPMTPRAKATSFSDEEETMDDVIVETVTTRRNSVGELVGAFEAVIFRSESQLLAPQKAKDIEESKIGPHNDDDEDEMVNITMTMTMTIGQHNDDEDEMSQQEEIKVEGEEEEEIKTEANQCTPKEEEEEEEDKSNNNAENKSTEVEAIESVDSPK